MPLLSQLSAVTGRPVRRRYGPAAERLGVYLPELYRRQQEEEYQDELFGLEEEGLGLDKEGLDLTRLGILANLLGGAQVGTSGLLAARRLKSVKDLAGNLGLAGKAASMIPPAGLGAIYGAPSIGAGAGVGDITFSSLSGGGMGGYGFGASSVPASASATSAVPATTGSGIFSGASGASIGAGLASLPILAKTLGDYFKGQRQERRGARESRALGNILPTLTDFGSYQPYLQGEVEAAAGIPATAGEGSSTLQRLFGRGRFSELAQEAGYGDELKPYRSMLGQIEQGKREGLQRFAPVARRLGLRPNVGRGDAHIAQEYWKRRREAQPTFNLDFGAGTATPVFPELEEDPYSYQNVGRP
jgi:hypothetical protein